MTDFLPQLMDVDAPVFVISVAAQLADMHPQTLRGYDRLGLVVPGRARGGGRRYSLRDIAKSFRFTYDEVKEYYDRCHDLARVRMRFQEMREVLRARFGD